METKVIIKKRQLRDLIFWATYGVSKATSGSNLKIIEEMKIFKKEYKLQVRLFELGQYTKN